MLIVTKIGQKCSFNQYRLVMSNFLKVEENKRSKNANEIWYEMKKHPLKNLLYLDALQINLHDYFIPFISLF